MPSDGLARPPTPSDAHVPSADIDHDGCRTHLGVYPIGCNVAGLRDVLTSTSECAAAPPSDSQQRPLPSRLSDSQQRPLPPLLLIHRCENFLQKYEEEFRGKKLVLSVERLDYSKGVPQKLEAIAQ